LAILRRLKCFCIANFSQPDSERCLYRAIRRDGASSIVELGLGTARRALRMIEMATTRGQHVRYAGIDEFESRAPDRPGLTLKQAYQSLRPTGAAIQLVPGDPLTALARVANSLTGTDLLIVSADVDAASLRAAWRYVPRMLHRHSRVYLEEACADGGVRRFVRLSTGEINRLAELYQPHRKAA
jgi:hypothetical protein